jgi:hypothetical protein
MKQQPAIQYLAFDVHQATIVANCRDAEGKVVMRATVATEARAILQLVKSCGPRVHVAFEEGTQAQWLHDLSRRAISAAALNRRLLKMISSFEQKHGPSFETITADNGTEFHSFEQIERRTCLDFYFATPYHSWERGTNENTNGLIRQYLPKRLSMAALSQAQCNAISRRLNERPRKRHDYATPLELLDDLCAPPRL